MALDMNYAGNVGQIGGCPNYAIPPYGQNLQTGSIPPSAESPLTLNSSEIIQPPGCANRLCQVA